MVGIVIGMIAIVVVMQALLNSDAGKRLEASGNDAQTTGAIAMNTVLRDVRQAGQGFSNGYLLGCQLTLWNGRVLSSLAPVTINPAGIPAGDANTDTVLVVGGATNGSPDGDLVTGQTTQAVYTMATPTTFSNGDVVVERPVATSAPPTCALTSETILSVDTTALTVTVGTGVAGMGNGKLYNLGQSTRLTASVYAVRNGNLTVCDYTQNNCADSTLTGSSSVWVPVADNIVSLRAQYGRDTNAGSMTGVVDTWDQTTPSAAATPPGVLCGWFRIQALRFVVVARSTQYDKDSGYTFNPANLTWAGTSTTPAAAVDVSGLADYQKYHYKLFQTTVPLRNIGWQGAQAGVTAGC
jgi:type IV pilus assembly protein PilW